MTSGEVGFFDRCGATRGRYGPDALFFANDLMAMGAMDALRRKVGLSVPGDVLVAGFDDIPAAAWASYDLTTVIRPAQGQRG